MRVLDVNSPFGHCLPSNFADFAFVRISKNASTSLVSNSCLGLNHYNYVPIAEYAPSSKVFACIRNPVDRFLSSIPETMCRYMRRHNTTKYQRSAVLVNEDIGCELDSLCGLVGKPTQFLFGYIDLVKQGFFDAHHQPQASFLSGKKRFYRDFCLFNLEDIDSAILKISQAYGLSGSRLGFANSRVGSEINAYKCLPDRYEFLRGLKQHAVRTLAKKGFYHSSYFEAPVNKFTKADCDIYAFCDELKKAFAGNAVFLNEVNRIYEYDIWLWRHVAQRSKYSESICSFSPDELCRGPLS